MATLSTAALNLLDWAKRLDPTKKTAAIVELLNEDNHILTDMLWQQGDLPRGLQVTQRTGLPTVAWRLINGGTTGSKSQTAQSVEQTAMLSALSQLDVKIPTGDVRAFRTSEQIAFLEAMNQEMAQTLFYGNSSTTASEFTGLAPRYADTTAANGQNIILGGGSGSDNTSIWLVGWGRGRVSGIFPMGSKAGIEHKDKGIVEVTTTTGIGGGSMEAYMDRWSWDAGLALEDWRYAVRICNIDISALAAQSNAADIPSLLIQATYRPPNLNGNFSIYMNRTVAQYLDIERRTDVIAGGGLTFENVDGKRQMFFRKIPIRICDQLLETEATVS